MQVDSIRAHVANFLFTECFSNANRPTHQDDLKNGVTDGTRVTDEYLN